MTKVQQNDTSKYEIKDEVLKIKLFEVLKS